MTTTDLKDFGKRELKIAAEILRQYANGDYPEEFYGNEVTIMMNKNSGYVFLTNNDYQVLMLNGEKLEMWYTLPYTGDEGFKEDFEDAKEEDYHHEDWEYIQEILSH